MSGCCHGCRDVVVAHLSHSLPSVGMTNLPSFFPQEPSVPPHHYKLVIMKFEIFETDPSQKGSLDSDGGTMF